jgi:hypothetical protein
VENDRCDDQADDRVGKFQPDRDDGGAREDAEADEAVDAGMLTVGDQRRALKAATGAQAHLGGELVADEADHSGSRQVLEMREGVRADEPLDRLSERYQGPDEDRKYHCESGEPFAAQVAKEEGEPASSPGALCAAPARLRPTRLVLTGAYSHGFHTSGELVLAIGWAIALASGMDASWVTDTADRTVVQIRP